MDKMHLVLTRTCFVTKPGWQHCSAAQSKKHSMYIYKAQQILPLHVQFNFNPLHAKKLYLHMLDVVDTVFSHEWELIICAFLQDFSKGKRSSL